MSEPTSSCRVFEEPRLAHTRAEIGELQRDFRACMRRGTVFTVVVRASLEFVDVDSVELSATDKHRFSSFKEDRDRLNFVAGRYLASQFIYGTNQLRDLRIDAQGKPLPHDGKHFNISHSGEYVAFSTSRHGPVGVDVEVRQGFERYEKTVDRLSHPNELAQLSSNCNDEDVKLRMRIWTRKEAMSKSDGVGIGFNLSAIDSKPAAEHGFPQTVANEFLMQTFECDPHAWTVSIATKKGNFEIASKSEERVCGAR